MTYQQYKRDLERGLEQLSRQKNILFGLWCASSLYAQRREQLSYVLTSEQSEALASVIEFLSTSADKPDSLDVEEIDEALNTCQSIDEDGNLSDSVEPLDYDVNCLLGIVESSLSYLLNDDLAYVKECAISLLNRIDHVLSFDYDIDTRDDSTLMNHPLTVAEVEAQSDVISYLRDNNPSSTALTGMFR